MSTLVLLLVLTLQAATPTTCHSVGLEPTRTWRFEKQGATWRVAHWRGSTRDDVASVALPASATVLLTPAALDVRARSSNGGVDVTLAGTPAQARLDIYVSYELEVNVDTSLTPAIDGLNTEGPVLVRCDLTPQH